MKNLSAYTAPSVNYPAFISINEHDSGSSVVVTVRGTATERGCGETVSIELPREAAQKLVAEFAAALHAPADHLRREET